MRGTSTASTSNSQMQNGRNEVAVPVVLERLAKRMAESGAGISHGNDGVYGLTADESGM